jgi:general secretion pathway protein G
MSHQKAFTLIEMLIVITIIGILAGFISFQIMGSINEGKDVKRKADIELLANAVVSYSSDHYSSKPITDFDGCQIGVDCGTEVESSLKAYLPTLPNDPNSDTSYIYQSNGNDCTISATLSNGEVYQYSCTNDAITTGTPITGVCGTAANTYDPGTTTFTGDFCASGNTNPTTPVFPSVDGTTVSWECSGEYLGNSATCTAYRGADGVCGSVTTTTETAYLPTDTDWPSSNYCSVGTTTDPSFPLEGGSTTWSCLPLYAGDTASCTAYRGQDGVCGSSSVDPNDNFYLSSEITNPCSTGTVSTITSSGSTPYIDYFKWTCSGTYTGSSSPQCTADKKVNGSCGTANGKYYETVPAAALRCNIGTPSNINAWTWTCYGLNEGNSSGTCIAYQRQPCSYYGGTMTTCGAVSCCRISGSSCPSGWTGTGYTTTIPYTYCGRWIAPSCSSGSCSCGTDWTLGGNPWCCTTGSHSWSNTGVDGCVYYCYNYEGGCGLGCSIVTAVGCY